MSLELFQLHGRTALITGGSKGLGKAMARALAQAGADVVLASRHEDELRQAQKEITEGTKSRCIYFVSDLSDRRQTVDLACQALDAMGHVDILINNAGIGSRTKLIELSDSEWDSVLSVNLTGPMVLARELAPQMVERRWGRIINISSLFGIVSREGRSAYAASKGAIIQLTRTWALEFGPHGVTVNAIAPGPFETEMAAAHLANPASKQWYTDRVPLGRWAQPIELAGPVLLLASNAGSYINGHVLAVDGGYLCQ